jgi:hypothetical protein
VLALPPSYLVSLVLTFSVVIFCAEWQAYASKEVSIADHLEQLSILVAR